MESLTPTKKIRVFTEKFESELKRRIQNRQASQKLRRDKDHKLNNFEVQIQQLEKENCELRQENQKLRETNDKLGKQVFFYRRAVENSFQSHKTDTETKDFEVVTEVHDGYYKRVEEKQKGQGFAKAFLILTIFTVMIQTVNVAPTGQEVFNSSERTARLNSLETDLSRTVDSGLLGR